MYVCTYQNWLLTVIFFNDDECSGVGSLLNIELSVITGYGERHRKLSGTLILIVVVDNN